MKDKICGKDFYHKNWNKNMATFLQKIAKQFHVHSEKRGKSIEGEVGRSD